MSDIRIFTDGSANNWTHSKGGYGFVIINGSVRQFCGGSYHNTTSARMEILAVIKALRKCEPSNNRIVVYSDNQYVVNALEKGWLFKWKKHNFAGKSNVDLWKLFLKEYTRLQGRIKMKWVRGHDDNHYNEVADILAKRGAMKEKKINDVKKYQKS